MDWNRSSGARNGVRVGGKRHIRTQISVAICRLKICGPPLACMVVGDGSRLALEQQLAALAERVASLELQVARSLELRNASASQVVHVHVGGGAGDSGATSSSAGGGPGPLTPKGHPATKVAKYYCLFVSVKDRYPAGIYTVYGLFTQAVKDDAVSWKGSGKIPFAPGVDCVSFTSRDEAESAVRERLGLSESEAVPYFW